jgi:hypothetical protein
MKKLQIAGLTIALILVTALLGPVCLKTGLKWAGLPAPWENQTEVTIDEADGSPPVSKTAKTKSSLFPHPDKAERENWLRKQPSKPTKAAKIVSWAKVFGPCGPKTLYQGGAFKVVGDIRNTDKIYYDPKGWAWTPDGVPVQRGGVVF